MRPSSLLTGLCPLVSFQDAHEFLNFLLNELVDILEKEAKASKEITGGTPTDGSGSLSGPLVAAKEGSPGRGVEARVSGDGGAPSALPASASASSAAVASAGAAASSAGTANGNGVPGSLPEESAGTSGQGRENGTSEGLGAGAGAGPGPGTGGVGAAGARGGVGTGAAPGAAPDASSTSAPPTWVHEIFQVRLRHVLLLCVCSPSGMGGFMAVPVWCFDVAWAIQFMGAESCLHFCQAPTSSLPCSCGGGQEQGRLSDAHAMVAWVLVVVHRW